MNKSKCEWKRWVFIIGIWSLAGLCLLANYNSTENVYDRGQKKLDAGNVQGAFRSFRKVVERQPEHAEAWYNLGVCYQKLRCSTEAFGAYQQALNKSQSVLTLYRLSSRYRELGYNSHAQAAYTKACQIDPRAVAMYNELIARVGQAGTARTENGSYYGEISENTGRPKTVYVRGYYRKDGTYVRGHYRSPPR